MAVDRKEMFSSATSDKEGSAPNMHNRSLEEPNVEFMNASALMFTYVMLRPAMMRECNG